MWPKYWSFSPSSEYLGLISFRIDWFNLLAVHGTLKSLSHKGKAIAHTKPKKKRVFASTTVQKHQFFIDEELPS